MQPLIKIFFNNHKNKNKVGNEKVVNNSNFILLSLLVMITNSGIKKTNPNIGLLMKIKTEIIVNFFKSIFSRFDLRK